MSRFSKSGQPEACPISSLNAALSWIPGYDDLCVPTIPLCHLVNLTASTPRMLICHDMMGGYQKDRFVQGHRYMDCYLLATFKTFSISHEGEVAGITLISIELSSI